jgi:hypothetical protein
VLGKIIDDLRCLDSMIAQLSQDLNQESTRSEAIKDRRNQVAQNVAQINLRLQREIREENQSIQVLNRLTSEINLAEQKRQEEQRTRGPYSSGPDSS